MGRRSLSAVLQVPSLGSPNHFFILGKRAIPFNFPDFVNGKNAVGCRYGMIICTSLDLI